MLSHRHQVTPKCLGAEQRLNPLFATLCLSLNCRISATARERNDGEMLARLLVAVGVVAAAVGFSFYGIATSTYEFYDRAGDLGIGLMVGGTIAAVIGGVWYRAQERSLR
jgi:hypothetical protein